MNVCFDFIFAIRMPCRVRQTAGRVSAAVGALLSVALLRLLNIPLADVLASHSRLLAVIGFFVAGFAKGIVNIVLLVLGALAGAAIVLGFFDLFNVGSTCSSGSSRWWAASSVDHGAPLP
jgi:hypothetical protein